MRVDEDAGLPVRWVQWRYGSAFGVVFRPDVPQSERSQVCAAWSCSQAAATLPAQRQPSPPPVALPACP